MSKNTEITSLNMSKNTNSLHNSPHSPPASVTQCFFSCLDDSEQMAILQQTGGKSAERFFQLSIFLKIFYFLNKSLIFAAIFVTVARPAK